MTKSMTDPANPSTLFQSFFLGGFESSTHKLRSGKRLDLLASTQHDVRAADDYRLLARHGIRTVRDAVRWHLVERRANRYEFDSFLPMLRAARETGTQVVWDLLHYGVPNGLEVWDRRFVDRFAAYARAVAQLVRDETDAVPFWTPVNEISFWAWGGGDTGGMNPFATGRGGELKAILARCAIAAIEAVRDVDPRARIAYAEPLINIIPQSDSEEHRRWARDHNEGQFEALDMVAGRRAPALGGKADYIDIVGVNYYYNNQWVDHGRTVYLGDWQYKPLHAMLAEVHQRYGRPVFVSETGTEGDFRPMWLHYVAEEVARARDEKGVPVEGICVYPIFNHLGWDDDRYCPNGMFCGVAEAGARTVYQPLAAEVARQAALFAAGPRYAA